jgi:BirA family biotin operon repressor/biotin-[acetyl-CoA-carboxylase] ligase
MKAVTVLDFLRENRERFTSGEDMSRRLGVSRAAIWKEMQGLRRLGYDIEAQPHLGYRLAGIPDKLFSDELTHQLDTSFIGREIHSYETLDSTNDAIFRLGKEGVKEGVCVFAEYQKKGRGRLGRSWVSPRGKNVLFSVLLRPVLSPAEVSKITLVAGISVISAVRQITGLTLGIKWPNDILHKEKKVCGILTEMSAEADRIHFVVLGIGVNVNSSRQELPPHATSLKEITGAAVSRILFGQTLLRQLERDIQRLKRGLFDELAEEWERYSCTSGRRVVANLLGRKVQGQAVGIDRDGALWIRRDDGLQEKVLAGDIGHAESF